ncbi:MAG TPA: hypothetical protein VGX68_08530 [Thermoanaerobaculia bacterium]|jgi:hypothetical protein|nr:hypothetical protein [Thermoanaerobaculia bacterium]
MTAELSGDTDPAPFSAAALWRRRLTRAFYWGAVGLVYFIVASAVLDSFQDHWAMGDKWRKSRFNKTIHHKVPPPFAYRVLTPWIVNAVAERLPPAAQAGLAARAQRLRARYHLREGNDVEYALAYYLIFLALFGTQFVWRANFRVLRLGSPMFWDFAPPVAMILLPMTFMQGGFIYDASELFLTGLALFFFLQRRWLGFYGTFFIAVLNKESNILLPVWFLAPFILERDWRFLLRHAALSVAVGSPPFLLVRYLFRDSPVDPLKLLIGMNFDYLRTASTYFSGFDVYAEAVPAPEGFHLFNLFLLAVLFWLVWRMPELREVRLIFACTVAAFLPFFLLFGYRDEIRVFGPAYAALVLLAGNCLRAVRTSSNPSREGEGLG